MTLDNRFIIVQQYGEYPKSWQKCWECGRPIWTDCLNDSCAECDKKFKDQQLKAEETRLPVDEADRWAIWERDNFTCQKCGSKRFLTIDHVLAVKNGGKNRLDNYQTLCKKCNSAKGAR